MIIKIKGTRSHWTLFDNAEEVSYRKAPDRIGSTSEIADFFPDPEEDPEINSVNLLTGMFREHAKVGRIHFNRLGIPHIVIFDTLAYLCNDGGGTVEKVVVTTGV